MLKKTISILPVFLVSITVYCQNPSDNIISRKTVNALPDEYPNGIYLMDSETNPDWNWPEDAGVILGLKKATSNSRHSQILLDRYGGKMLIRGKNWANNQWTSWKKVLIENQGRVGIGTSNPDASLEVSGDRSLLFNNTSGSVHLRRNSSGGWAFGYKFLGSSGTDHGGFGGYGSSDSFNYYFIGTTHQSPLVTILPNGNVGIGTKTTGSHRLAVEGSIGAREIIVEATDWPDFVFEKDYELRTLEEIEQHINEKGHLPEIPTKAEVTENGINVGEMDAKLLQKIEELTLCLIDVNKQLKGQSNEIKQLKLENRELKEQIANKFSLKKVRLIQSEL